jgi:hypothetical protein
MAYELLLTEKDELHLCFRLSGETAERCGAIGYLRADFGRGGKEFYTTWFDSQPHLKSYGFKNEFDELINSLRDDGQEPPFASRGNHSAFCAARPSMTCFKIATLDYSFYFRFNPQQGTYDIYCFAYDNRYLLPERAGQHELPQQCYSVLPATGELISIRRGEQEYTVYRNVSFFDSNNRQYADLHNKKNGVTRAQEEAMLAGSLFGWDTPAAKPWNYDKDGKPRPIHPPKKDNRER